MSRDDRDADELDRRLHLDQLRRDPGVHDPSALPELAALFSALRRGTKRGKLRLLDIACCNRHRLAEVFPAPGSPVILAFGRRVNDDDVIGGLVFEPGQSPRSVMGSDPLDYGLTAERSRHRQPVAFRLDEVYAIAVQCRCREVIIPATWVTDHLAAKHQKAIWTDSPKPT